MDVGTQVTSKIRGGWGPGSFARPSKESTKTQEKTSTLPSESFQSQTADPHAKTRAELKATAAHSKDSSDRGFKKILGYLGMGGLGLMVGGPLGAGVALAGFGLGAAKSLQGISETMSERKAEKQLQNLPSQSGNTETLEAKKAGLAKEVELNKADSRDSKIRAVAYAGLTVACGIVGGPIGVGAALITALAFGSEATDAVNASEEAKKAELELKGLDGPPAPATLQQLTDERHSKRSNQVQAPPRGPEYIIR